MADNVYSPVRVRMAVNSDSSAVPVTVASNNVMRRAESGATITTGTDYEKLKNKPQINGVELIGNKSFEDLGEDTITNVELQNIINEQYALVFGGN